MSFWDNMKKLTQPYAEDDYDEYDEEYDDEYDDEPAEPAPRRERRRPAPAPAPAPMMDEEEEEEEDFYPSPAASAAPAAPSVGFSGAVLSRSAATAKKQDVVLFRPNVFGDIIKAADDLCAQKAVIVNMENIDGAVARRIVDFMSGCIYAMNGNAQKIAAATFLFCPPNMNIVGNLDALQAEAEAAEESYV